MNYEHITGGDFSLDDASCWSISVEIDISQIKTILKNNQCYTTAVICKIFKLIYENYFHKVDYVSHFDK